MGNFFAHTRDSWLCGFILKQLDFAKQCVNTLLLILFSIIVC